LTRNACIVFVAFFAVAALAPCSASAQDPWQFRMTPYIWVMTRDGNAALGPIAFDIHTTTKDLLEGLEMTLQLQGEARKGKNLILTDVFYARVHKDSEELPLRIKNPMFVVVAAAGRTFKERFDVYGGIRYYHVKLTLDFTPTNFPDVTGQGEWVDPIVGGRAAFPIGEKLTFAARGDIGGFGAGSTFTFMVQPSLTWQLRPNLGMLVGYRLLNINYETGEGNTFFKYDVPHAGLGFGFTLSF
jgi:hypothetical protein